MATILETTRENKHMYDKISSLGVNFEKLTQETLETIKKIKEINAIVFKGFCSKRIPTAVKITGVSYDSEKCEVYVNTKGISFKAWQYGENTNYIDSYDGHDFIKILKQLKEKEKEILPYVPLNKKYILTNFLKDVETLSKNDYSEIPLNANIFDLDHKPMTIIKGDLREIKFFRLNTNEPYMYYSINLTKQGLKDQFLIEQIYPELKSIIEQAISEEEKVLKSYKDFLDNLKTTFAKEVIANKL